MKNDFLSMLAVGGGLLLTMHIMIRAGFLFCILLGIN